MTAPESSEPSLTVLIGGREYPKPYDPACPCCRSPWLITIDEMLAEGYTYAAIRKHLAGRRPSSPTEAHIREHVPHLAGPHRKMRAEVEASAAGEESPSLVGTAEANRAVIREGFKLLVAGQLEVSGRDLVAALRLQAQMEQRDQAGTLDASAWQAAFVEFFGIVRHHLNPAQWQSFVTEVYASPVIRTVLAEPSPEIPQGVTSA